MIRKPRPRGALPEERGRRADPAEVAAAEDDPRDRDAAAAEGSLVHPADPTAASLIRRRFDPLGSSTARPDGGGAADDVRRRRTTATTRCATAAAAAAGSRLPAISLGLWHNFGGDRPARDAAARSCAAPSTSASRTSTSRTTTARRTARRRRPSAGCSRDDLAPYRDELIISTKAGYDMWPGPYGDGGSRKYLLASLDQSLGADGARLRRHLLLAPARPRHAARGDDGRARHAPCARARRSTSGSRPTRPSKTREAAAILRELGTPLLIHQPSYSMLNRWIEPDLARRARRARGRLHRLLAARAGPAHRPLPGRHPGGLAREPRRLALARHAHGRDARQGAGAERDRRGAGPVAGADGARLDAARPARHLGARRREQRRAARAEPRRARASSSSRPTSSPRSTVTRPRLRQPLGGVERALTRAQPRRWSTAASARAT